MHDVYENRVRFEETDAQGIVFYGNYVTYQDETFTAFMEAIDYPYDEAEERGWRIHVVNVELDYRDSATFGDELVNAMRADAIRKSSISFEYECRRAEDDAVLVEGSLVHVAVDEAGETTRIPDDFREAVVAFQDESPDPV